MSRSIRLMVCGLAACLTAALASAETVSFQEGVDGYAGTFQMRILSTTAGGGQMNESSVFLDGFKDMAEPTADEPDRWELLRFDNILGTGPGQIPLGATILSARLEFVTEPQAVHGAAESPGPIGLARMLKPSDSTSRWQTFGTEGPDFAGGDYDRPAGGVSDLNFGATDAADVRPIVQAWSDGAPNYGFLVICATTDGWYHYGIGNLDPAVHPKLVVEYVAQRTKPIIFQQDVDGYAGFSMLRVVADGTTTFGTGVEVATTGAYLDGFSAAPESDALLKFDNAFGTGPGQIPPSTTIVKAYVSLTTPPKANSNNVRSPGPFGMYRLLMPANWDGNGTPFFWSDWISGDGPTEADGEISPALSTAKGMVWDNRSYFDVTAAVEAWRSGAPNHGLAVKPLTNDGWKIYWANPIDAVETRPQLILLVPSKRGADFNLDTKVNDQDLTMFTTCSSGPAVPYAGGCAYADLDDDMDIDSADFGVFQACWSGAQPATALCR